MADEQFMNSMKLIRALLFYLFLTGLTQSALLTVGKEGANYTVIQDAIDAASPGDVIEVRGGNYLENVIANKMLVLRGSGNPVIDSNGNGSAVKLINDGIVLEGFALINASSSGIEIDYNDNITIRNNIIRNNLNGITIHESFNSSILGNTISNNANIGLDLEDSALSAIAHNIIHNNNDGIILRGSNENAIEYNLIVNNTAYGISLENRFLSEAGPGGFSDKNLLEKNQIEGNEYGIYLKYSEGNDISANRLINNNHGIYSKYSLNNTIRNNDYVNNIINESYDSQSRSDIWPPEPTAVFLVFGFIFISANIIFGIAIGIISGLIIKKTLKYSSLSLISKAILGIIGSIMGFYGCLIYFSSNLLISFIAAAASSFILILLVEILRHSGRGINI
ncbi:MAG: right-handed parallel beta-helix repeat-containing protein [Methanotrichaceae archaeon]|nr:right-handed parallel beta-helix repeat-containing protein [Methanotrichaceae archaeon]